MEYNGKFGNTIGRIHQISIMSIIGILYTAYCLRTQMCHLLLIISKVSSAASNIWLVTLINLYFILIIIMMDKIL